jgi:hypothetical protein
MPVPILALMTSGLPFLAWLDRVGRIVGILTWPPKDQYKSMFPTTKDVGRFSPLPEITGNLR